MRKIYLRNHVVSGADKARKVAIASDRAGDARMLVLGLTDVSAKTKGMAERVDTVGIWELLYRRNLVKTQ